MRGGGWSPDEYMRERYPDWRVVEWDLQPGLLSCRDCGERIIYLARGLDRVRRRCVLAFEAGRLLQGPTPADPCLAAARQRAAVDWAAVMLIPSELFVEAWGHCVELPELAAYCGVDVPTFRNRIRAASDGDQDAAMEAIGRMRLSA
jgi:hypothetical protein